ncbi:MAG: DNA repair protein RecN [Rhodospirillales bacterium]|nr:DNA repair protein RecN [Rhodospirillales bacterium]
MLLSLSIRDLAVIEQVDLDLSAGLTVLTGETGAGKSILLDALGLATGRRAEASLVRPGRDRASVAATFSVTPDSKAKFLLADRGIDVTDEIIVRREIHADGRSKAFVNDEPVGVALLSDLGELLVEVHGQHDQRGLLRPEFHRNMLDAFGGHVSELDLVAQTYLGWQDAAAALDRLTADEETLRERREMLAREVGELNELVPVAGEDEGLAAQRMRLANAQKIAEALTAAMDALGDDDGVDARLRRAAGELERVRDVAAGAADEPLAALDRALLEANEALECMTRAGHDLDADAGELERIEERLFALRAAARRHKVTVDELPDLQARLAGELADMQDGEGSLERLRAAEQAARSAFDKACVGLSKRRARAAKELDRAVADELEPLRMARARFTTSLQPVDSEDHSAMGAERVVFQVVTNPGAPPGPLSKIASGGELSRFMLALKVAAQKRQTGGTLIFDEIDAGIGGAVSDAVGERLHRLAADGQVLVVTHAPQVAARADSHIRLLKQGDDISVSTSARLLDADARREELARMLAGAEITEAARAAAESLLKTGS